LIDKDSKMVYKLQKTSTLAVNSFDGTRQFRLIVGSKSFAEANNLGIDLTPGSFVLYQNYPNPFNPSTTLRYALPVRSSVTISIYDILGRKVDVPVTGEQSEGYHEAEWLPKVSSGIYFYRIEVTAIDDPGKRFVDVKKMVLLR
jgi:hypothetical protein